VSACGVGRDVVSVYDESGQWSVSAGCK